nr:MAG TPA: hypothetical protein [Caudoviricetes sp.]
MAKSERAMSIGEGVPYHEWRQTVIGRCKQDESEIVLSTQSKFGFKQCKQKRISLCKNLATVRF